MKKHLVFIAATLVLGTAPVLAQTSAQAGGSAETLLDITYTPDEDGKNVTLAPDAPAETSESMGDAPNALDTAPIDRLDASADRTQ